MANLVVEIPTASLAHATHSPHMGAAFANLGRSTVHFQIRKELNMDLQSTYMAPGIPVPIQVTEELPGFQGERQMGFRARRLGIVSLDNATPILRQGLTTAWRLKTTARVLIRRGQGMALK